MAQVYYFSLWCSLVGHWDYLDVSGVVGCWVPGIFVLWCFLCDCSWVGEVQNTYCLSRNIWYSWIRSLGLIDLILLTKWGWTILSCELEFSIGIWCLVFSTFCSTMCVWYEWFSLDMSWGFFWMYFFMTLLGKEELVIYDL